MNPHFRSRSIALSMMTFVACSSDDHLVVQSEDSIVGGALENEYPSAGYLVSEAYGFDEWAGGPDGYSDRPRCGVTLIRPNVAITAAHCVANPFWNWGIGLGQSQFFRGVAKTHYTAKKIFVHPDYKQFVGHDVAIMVLDANAPVAPAEIGDITTDVGAGQLTTDAYGRATTALIGYGRVTAGGPHSNNDPTIGQTAERKKAFQTVTGIDNLVISATGINGGGCAGDSGSGLRGVGASQNKIYGIVSWTQGDCSVNTPLVFARLSTDRAFIDTALACVDNPNCSCETGSLKIGSCTALPPKPTLPQAEQFVGIDAGFWQTCATRSDGKVFCQAKYNDSGEATPPSALSFTQVSAGASHTCGVKTDGTITCWGGNPWKMVKDSAGVLRATKVYPVAEATPPAGTFASVSAGRRHTCGVRSDATISCWGSNESGRAAQPTGAFKSVSAGESHTCAVRSDGIIICWGNNDWGKATPPTGTFTSVSAGAAHTCGIRADSGVTCWGLNRTGWTAPPTGSFTSINAGYYATCGVKTDGTITCWGATNGAPTGSFIGVSVSQTEVCGVTTNGTIDCKTI